MSVGAAGTGFSAAALAAPVAVEKNDNSKADDGSHGRSHPAAREVLSAYLVLPPPAADPMAQALWALSLPSVPRCRPLPQRLSRRRRSRRRQQNPRQPLRESAQPRRRPLMTLTTRKRRAAVATARPSAGGSGSSDSASCRQARKGGRAREGRCPCSRQAELGRFVHRRPRSAARSVARPSRKAARSGAQREPRPHPQPRRSHVGDEGRDVQGQGVR